MKVGLKAFNHFAYLRSFMTNQTKLLYIPTGKFIKFLPAGTISIYVNAERTLIVEDSVFRHTDRVFDMLYNLREEVAGETFIVRDNELKFPILEGEIVVCE